MRTSTTSSIGPAVDSVRAFTRRTGKLGPPKGAKDHRKTKLEAYALATNQDVVDRLQTEAQSRVQKLLKQHAAAIKALPEDGRQAFNEIRGLARDPELTQPVYPENPEVSAVAGRVRSTPLRR